MRIIFKKLESDFKCKAAYTNVPDAQILGKKAYGKNMKTRMGIKLSEKSTRKVDSYIEKYGEFEAYNAFGGRSVEEGIKNMIRFYKEYPAAPV